MVEENLIGDLSSESRDGTLSRDVGDGGHGISPKDFGSLDSSDMMLVSVVKNLFVRSTNLFCSGVYGAEVSRSVPSVQSWFQNALLVNSDPPLLRMNLV